MAVCATVILNSWQHISLCTLAWQVYGLGYYPPGGISGCCGASKCFPQNSGCMS